jgi:hypothetical protein
MIFNFHGHTVRTTIIDGEPWWSAGDVCDVLGLTRGQSSIDRLESSEKGTHSMSTPGGNQDVAVINESGLYSLIMRSRRPEAKAFRLWVTGEMLPAIRKTGRYIAPNPMAYVSPGQAVAAVRPASVDPVLMLQQYAASNQQMLMALGGKTLEIEAIATMAMATSERIEKASVAQDERIAALARSTAEAAARHDEWLREHDDTTRHALMGEFRNIKARAIALTIAANRSTKDPAKLSKSLHTAFTNHCKDEAGVKGTLTATNITVSQGKLVVAAARAHARTNTQPIIRLRLLEPPAEGGIRP